MATVNTAIRIMASIVQIRIGYIIGFSDIVDGVMEGEQEE